MKSIKAEFSRIFKVTKWILSLYIKNFPFYTSIYLFCRLIISFWGLINTYVIALVTDTAFKIINNGSSRYETTKIMVLILGSYLFFAITQIINSYVWRMIQFQDWFVLRKTLADRLIKLGIRQLEDPEVSNKTQRFNEITGQINDYLQWIVNTFASLAIFLVSGVVVIKAMPLVSSIYFMVILIQFLSNQKFIRKLWINSRDNTEIRRSAGQSSNLLIEPGPLKELILSGGHAFLTQRINDYLMKVVHEYKSVHKNWSVWQVINEILEVSVFGYGIFVVIKRLLNGLISVGKLTFEIGTLKIFADNLSNISSNLVSLRESTIKIGDVYELFTKYEDEKDGFLDIKGDFDAITLKNLWFKYPNGKAFIFKGLDLQIKRGEKIAIVGVNGAGKTTLVKLICRFYRATKGEISIASNNIENIRIGSWYKKIGALFQDYNTYGHLTVKENVEIDSFKKNNDGEMLVESLRKSDALSFVKEYKNGINQILSERFENGIRPSTGQWQKIAIARLFYRDPEIIILDEPTASIDAESEAKIFDNIFKFAKSKTVIIISHRFSTVRNADRIMVIDGGRVIEQGSHKELLKLKGKYAKAFNLQAKGYK